MNIVISGTGKGIGYSIALKFLKEGHRVFGFDIKEGSIDDPKYMHILCDISRTDLDEIELPDECRKPDIIINNAGTFDEEAAIDVNLKGTMGFTEYFMDSPDLRSVLFIASASARNGSEFPYYAASKAGIVGFMKNLAMNLGKRGITVNSISPGGVITDSNDHILKSEKLYRAVLDENILGKWAEPGEVADLAYFMTVINRSITGEDILMDNGEMLKSNFIW